MLLLSRANDDFGQAEPARFAANAFAANGSPVYLYRFSYVADFDSGQMRAGAPHGGEIAYVFGTLSGGPRRSTPTAPRYGGLAHGAELLGELRQVWRPERNGFANVAAPCLPEKIKSLTSGRMAPRAPDPIPGKHDLM